MAHALLSPSAAKRWINCTASARLEYATADKETDYAAEGTLAHAIAEDKARKLVAGKGSPRRAADAEMEEATNYYAEFILQIYAREREAHPETQAAFEQRVELGEWARESFGTADCIILNDERLIVIDFKYGSGVRVAAKGNEQLRCYALGALDKYGTRYGFSEVVTWIVQPRLNNTTSERMTTTDLQKWGNDILKPAAELAYKGEGAQAPGEWCKFCKVRATCAALKAEADKALEVCPVDDAGRLLKPEAVAEVLGKVELIASWCNAVKEFALSSALTGVHYEGFKLVAGRSARKILAPDVLAGRLVAAGFSEKEIYKPRELLTITALEKKVTKKFFAEVSEGLINKPPGAPTLVRSDDPREELKSAAGELFDN